MCSTNGYVVHYTSYISVEYIAQCVRQGMYVLIYRHIYKFYCRTIVLGCCEVVMMIIPFRSRCSQVYNKLTFVSSSCLLYIFGVFSPILLPAICARSAHSRTPLQQPMCCLRYGDHPVPDYYGTIFLEYYVYKVLKVHVGKNTP